MWNTFAGFKTPLGTVAITGLHVLPIWLYGRKAQALRYVTALDSIAYSLVFARIICASVEVWCLWKYILLLLHRRPHKDAEKAVGHTQ